MTAGPGEIGIGVIGLGFMGLTHVRAYQAARERGHACRLVAACDQDPQARSGGGSAGNLATGTGGVRFDEDVSLLGCADEVLRDARVDAVSICTHTDTHVPLTLAALEAGKHVLVEKPLALDPHDVLRVQRAAVVSGRICMPAMCMRFWPGWDWLKARVEDGSLGAVVSASFTRLGAGPSWAREFYGDEARSGGALADLHVHDADFIRWLFGDPVSVRSVGSLRHVATQYRFAGGPAVVTAEGGWTPTFGFPFRMRYTVAFERGVADFDLARETPLLLHTDAGTETVPTEGPSGYEAEVAHFLRVIAGAEPARATADDALGVARLLQAERRSIETGVEVRVAKLA